MTDPRIEAAIAEMQSLIPDVEDELSNDADSGVGHGVRACITLLRRHFAKPHPIIAELEALAVLCLPMNVTMYYKLNAIITKYKEKP
jgi:hypothetical protein